MRYINLLTYLLTYTVLFYGLTLDHAPMDSSVVHISNIKFLGDPIRPCEFIAT